MENSNPKKILDLYIHDLFVKNNMHDLAEILLKVANLQHQDAVTIDNPKGFLYDWYTILSEECKSVIAKQVSYPTEDASKSKGFLRKWVPLLCIGGEQLLQWFPLFHDRYCAEIAKRGHATQDSSSQLYSIDKEIAKQVLRKLAFELYWLGAGQKTMTARIQDLAISKNSDRAPKRLRKLSDWFTAKCTAELEKHADATKDSAASSEVLIQELLPIFIRKYSAEIANRPNATQDSSSKIDFDGEIAKQVVRKMASDPALRLEAAKKWNLDSEQTGKYKEIVEQAAHMIASDSRMLETVKQWNSNNETSRKHKRNLHEYQADGHNSK